MIACKILDYVDEVQNGRVKKQALALLVNYRYSLVS